jgi:hypothetical protein
MNENGKLNASWGLPLWEKDWNITARLVIRNDQGRKGNF